MRQIFSWTVGSFFRTIGRTVALLGMGAILYYIASRLGFGISDLFFDKVNASSYQNNFIGSSKYRIGDSGNWNNSTLSNDNYWQINTMLNGSQRYYMSFGDNAVSIPSNIKLLKLNIKYSIKEDTQTTYTTTNQPQTTCTLNSTYESPAPWGNIYDASWNVTGKYEDIELRYNYFTCNAQTTTSTTTTDINKFSLTLGYYFNDNTGLQTPCYATSNSGDIYSFECPVTTNNINGLVITISTNKVIRFDTGFNYLMTMEKDATQQIIDNQNHNTQSLIEQNQNSTNQMLDTNSTSTDQKADSFFGSFDTNETYGGLSSIVTAPLVVVNQMLSNTCVAPSATWKGATITLPCGDMFWSRPGAVDLQNLLNVFYGGFICYYAIRKLFLMIENFKDPTHDKIEVTDL